jgi:hypothetical protein
MADEPPIACALPKPTKCGPVLAAGCGGIYGLWIALSWPPADILRPTEQQLGKLLIHETHNMLCQWAGSGLNPATITASEKAAAAELEARVLKTYCTAFCPPPCNEE